MKIVTGFGNYTVDSDGDIQNVRTGRVLKHGKNQKGYHFVILSDKGRQSTVSIHRLVYKTFKGEIPKGFELNHIDGNKDNNNSENLELVTHKENMLKAVEIGLIKSGSNNKLSKSVLQINVITNEIIREFGSQREAEKETGIPSSGISSCCNGNRITAGGYKWSLKL
jgi:hypothetical protein